MRSQRRGWEAGIKEANRRFGRGLFTKEHENTSAF